MEYKINIYFFTENGRKLSVKIGGLSLGTFRDKKIQFNIINGCDMSEQLFKEIDAHIFVGAMGIAVRKIAPFIESKLTDPAVIVIDELGRNIIPVLSGHIGGANELSKLIALKLNANAVITTATDINGFMAIDTLAIDNGLLIKDSAKIKIINSKILQRETVKIFADEYVRLVIKPESGFIISDKENADVIISSDLSDNKFDALHLFNPNIVLGIGCRKDTDSDVFESTVCEALSKDNLSPENVMIMSSIDIKSNESAILNFSDKYRIKFVTHAAEELSSVSGDFDESEFVKGITGVSNVSERAAVIEAKSGGKFIQKRIVENGITITIIACNKEIYI